MSPNINGLTMQISSSFKYTVLSYFSWTLLVCFLKLESMGSPEHLSSSTSVNILKKIGNKTVLTRDNYVWACDGHKFTLVALT